jgi:type VI secretion system protein VasJ
MELDALLESTDLAPMLAAVRRACGPLEAGQPDEDPRYRERFVDIKQEIDKLQGADLGRVVQAGLSFLAEEAKDLRIAGYLALALVARFGAGGLMTAALLYRSLLEGDVQGLHPRKPGQRASSVAWLNSPRMDALLGAAEPDLRPDQWQALEASLAAIAQLCAEHIRGDADAPAGWPAAHRWVEENRPADTQTQSATDSPIERATPPRSSAAPAPALPATDGALSQEQLLAHGRVLHDALLEQGLLIQAAGLARSVRWGALKEPPHEGGTTRIPPPREGAWTELDCVERDSGALEAYLLGARLMFEPGFQWSMDLQRRLAELAARMPDELLRNFIEGEAALFVQRLPAVSMLHFADGSPFAGEGARDWLAGLGAHRDRDAMQSDSGEGFDELLAGARAEPDLGRAFALLDAVPAATARQRCRLDLLRAELCLDAKRAQVAYGLLMELKRRVEGMQVMEWDPEVGTRLYVTLRRAAIALKKTSNGNGVAHGGLHPGAVVEECERLIAGLNPTRALHLV